MMMKQGIGRAGFTIIELMLFFAVSSVLTIIMLVGLDTALSQQKYKDSLTSLQTFIQMQYTNTANVENTRADAAACNSADAINLPAGDNAPRGMSECVVIGRYISTNTEATRVYAANVIAIKQSNAVSQKNDLDELKQYTFKSVDPGVTSTDDAFRVSREDINWSAGLVPSSQPGAAVSSDPAPFTMLIIRSPLSGSVTTYHLPKQAASFDELLAPSSVNTTTAQPLVLCVRPNVRNSLHIVEPARMGVRINAFATNQSAVEIPSEGEHVCDKS